MIRFSKRKMGMAGLLLMLLILNPACKDKNPDPVVVEQQAVTLAFKMPVAVGKAPISSVSPSGTTSLDSREKKKTALVSQVAAAGDSAQSDNAMAETAEYTGDGKVDPFAPLIKNEPVRVKEPERPRTPLERLDYSQMKLVAIVGRGTEYVAMVEEAGGKGYIVTVGTYIGRNGGVVSEIRNDRVIVHERVKDFKGDMITHTQEIKLNKTEDKEV